MTTKVWPRRYLGKALLIRPWTHYYLHSNSLLNIHTTIGNVFRKGFCFFWSLPSSCSSHLHSHCKFHLQRSFRGDHRYICVRGVYKVERFIPTLATTKAFYGDWLEELGWDLSLSSSSEPYWPQSWLTSGKDHHHHHRYQLLPQAGRRWR